MGILAVDRLLAQLEENLESAKLSLKRESMIRCDVEAREVNIDPLSRTGRTLVPSESVRQGPENRRSHLQETGNRFFPSLQTDDRTHTILGHLNSLSLWP
jgi:hypothetical protein